MQFAPYMRILELRPAIYNMKYPTIISGCPCCKTRLQHHKKSNNTSVIEIIDYYYCTKDDHHFFFDVGDNPYFYLDVDQMTIGYHDDIYYLDFDTGLANSIYIEPFDYDQCFFILNKMKSLMAFI